MSHFVTLEKNKSHEVQVPYEQNLIITTCLMLLGYWEELRSCFGHLELFLEHKGLDELQITSLISLAQILELLSGEGDLTARRDNTEKNLDMFFASLALPVWVEYLRC